CSFPRASSRSWIRFLLLVRFRRRGSQTNRARPGIVDDQYVQHARNHRIDPGDVPDLAHIGGELQRVLSFFVLGQMHSSQLAANTLPVAPGLIRALFRTALERFMQIRDSLFAQEYLDPADRFVRWEEKLPSLGNQMPRTHRAG